jgi:hypothetical protein
LAKFWSRLLIRLVFEDGLLLPSLSRPGKEWLMKQFGTRDMKCR